MRESADPSPRAGQVLIRVRAAGVNFADVSARLGFYPDAPPFPCVVGYEVAGVVEQAPDVSGIAPGQRVVALTRFGGYAEAVAVPAAQVFPLPDAPVVRAGRGDPGELPDRGPPAAPLRQREGGRAGAGPRGGRRRRHGGDPALPYRGRGGDRDRVGEQARGAEATRAWRIRSTTARRTSRPRCGASPAAAAWTSCSTRPGAFRKSYRCLAPLGRLLCFGFSTAATGMTPNRLAAIPKLLAIPFFPPRAADERQQGRHRREPGPPLGADRPAADARCSRCWRTRRQDGSRR